MYNAVTVLPGKQLKSDEFNWRKAMHLFQKEKMKFRILSTFFKQFWKKFEKLTAGT